MLAMPIIALYEISIFGAKIIAPKTTDEAAD
jgi:Sec-independent protein secretion pathway component TatC